MDRISIDSIRRFLENDPYRQAYRILGSSASKEDIAAHALTLREKYETGFINLLKANGDESSSWDFPKYSEALLRRGFKSVGSYERESGKFVCTGFWSNIGLFCEVCAPVGSQAVRDVNLYFNWRMCDDLSAAWDLGIRAEHDSSATGLANWGSPEMRNRFRSVLRLRALTTGRWYRLDGSIFFAGGVGIRIGCDFYFSFLQSLSDGGLINPWVVLPLPGLSSVLRKPILPRLVADNSWMVGLTN